jgi:hypothetical protein
VGKVMMEEDLVVTGDQDLGAVARKRNQDHVHMSAESAQGSKKV